MKGTYEDAIFICNTLESADFRAYLAGGCVRDILLGVNPSDYDITTSATPDQVQRLFTRTIPVGISFGVVKVVCGDGKDGGELDVATFRTDGKYSDNRRPDDVQYTISAEEDVKRRDFTINALLMDTKGKIHDYVGGEQDLKRRVLRTVGNPVDRFDEDALRMLRAVRFAIKYNLDIHPDTWQSIQNHASGIGNVSKERITEEFSKMMTGKRPELAYWTLNASFLMSHMFSGISLDLDDRWKIMEALSKMPPSPDFSLPLAIMSVEMVDRELSIFTGKLCLTNTQKQGREDILNKAELLKSFTTSTLAVQRRMMHWPNLQTYKTFLRCVSNWGYSWTINPPIGSFDLESGMKIVTDMGFPDPLINGNDLMAWGYYAGPVFTDMIESVETQQLEGLISSKEGARVWIRDHFPAAKRTLADGTIIDGMARKTYMSKCPTCHQVMSFTAECLADGNMNWASVKDQVGVRVTNSFFATCTRETGQHNWNRFCSGKRAKHNFRMTHV